MTANTTNSQNTATDSRTPDKPPSGPEIIFTAGKKITIYPNGAQVTECTDGTVITESGGKKVTEQPDGTKITEENGFKTTEHPDGTIEKERPFAADLLLGAAALGMGMGISGMFAEPKQPLSGEASFLTIAMTALGTTLQDAAQNHKFPQVSAPKRAVSP